ncbi:UNVERIFIED_CONTAM: hypothetical protein HDU68_011226 [Siphonaria sp. JEL0065]|nr:hypothetical protein HDU68_011226 [Siphonaria sp. JEL0065]
MKRASSTTSLATTRNIHRLVAVLAKDADDSQRLAAAKKASNALAFHPFASTNEDRVVAQYNGLIEKWDLFGESNKAHALKLLLDEALASAKDVTSSDSLNQFAIHQVIAFLLFMSNSADANANDNGWNSPPSVTSKSIPQKPSSFLAFKKKAAESAAVVDSSLAFMNTLHQSRLNPGLEDERLWKEIVDSDPLEGDHWQSVDYGRDYSDSEIDDDGNERFDSDLENVVDSRPIHQSSLHTDIPPAIATAVVDPTVVLSDSVYTFSGLITPPNELIPV